MPHGTWRVYCLRTEASAGSLEEVGSTYVDGGKLKSGDVIEVNADSYRVVFFVHPNLETAGKLVVVPA
jgi:hypothetical protein